MFGFVTWQDGVQSEDGRTWIDGCGRVTETTELVPPDKDTPPTTTPPPTPPAAQQPPDLTTQRVNNPASPPSIPKAPATPTNPSNPSAPPSLAVTGAGVGVLALVALGLVAAGLVLVHRRRNSSGEVPA